MEVKLLELRDKATFIPLLCVDMNPSNNGQLYLLRRCGYHCDHEPNILITKANGDGDGAANDPYYWGDRTRTVAHDYIIKNWKTLVDGDVIDVEHILGETKTKKISERLENDL